MAKDEEKVSVEFTKEELDYYLKSLEKAQSNYPKGSDMAGTIALLRGKMIRASESFIENIETAFNAYQKEFLSSHDRSQDEVIKGNLNYIEMHINAIRDCLNKMDTVDESCTEGDDIRGHVLDIEAILVELHERIDGHCWQIEMVTMDLMTALHKMLLANNLYY